MKKRFDLGIDIKVMKMRWIFLGLLFGCQGIGF
jgi:hypothetical protein